MVYVKITVDQADTRGGGPREPEPVQVPGRVQPQLRNHLRGPVCRIPEVWTGRKGELLASLKFCNKHERFPLLSGICGIFILAEALLIFQVCTILNCKT